MTNKEEAKKVKSNPAKPGKIDITGVSMEIEDGKLLVTGDIRVGSTEIMSTELQNGMVIKAQNGGRPKNTQRNNQGATER